MAMTMRGYGHLLRDRHFVALAVIPALISSVLMAYIVASPFVLQEQYGLSKLQFAMVFALNGIGLVGGAQINAALVKAHSPSKILRTAMPASFLFCLALMGVGLTGWGGLPALMVTLFCVMSLQNLSSSNASALALTRHGERAGTAAACLGFLQSLVPALVAPVVGLLGNQAWAMGMVMAASAATALVILGFGTPIYRPGGVELLDRLPSLNR